MFLHVSVILSTGDVASHIARGSASGWVLHRGGAASRGVWRGWADSPKIHEILQDTVNKRVVRILLERFLILEKYNYFNKE